MSDLPHNVEAERGLLACVLLDGASALSKALDAKITEDAFYDPKHTKFWRSILWLHSKNLPIDAVILAEELTRVGKLEDVGGVYGISVVTADCPTTAQFTYFLEQVRELYVRRCLIANAEGAAAKARAGAINVEDYVASTHAILSIRHATQNIKTLVGATDDAIAEAERAFAGKRTEEDVGLQWPWPSWNAKFGPARAGEMIILAARPGMGKSSAARQCALKWQKEGEIALFSREMPIGQLPHLFAQQISGVSWREARNGRATPDMERAFNAALLEVKAMKRLHVFDRDRTLAQVSARVRALHQMRPLRAVVIDYLQRYDPQQEKGENRDTALGRMSMAFKDMAIDLNIPCLVLAQIGRAVERENRPPRLSDLRECLSVKDTLIFTCQGVTMNVMSPISTVSLNNGGEIVSTDSRNANRKDAPEFVRVRLQSGREIVCTPKHPIKTDRGWVAASELDDHSIACVRTIPSPRNTENYSFAKWIGWMLGNGCMTGYGSPSFICSCKDVADSFVEQSKALWGFDPKPHAHKCKAVFQYDLTNSTVRTPEGNPVRNWLKQHDLWGPKAHEKKVPDWFCQTADNESLAELLAGLWETDGCVIARPRPQIQFATTSRTLAWQVIWALNRLGIFANIDSGYMSKTANHLCCKVVISRADEIRAFRGRINLIGRKGDKLAKLNVDKDGNTSGSRLGKHVGWHIEEMRKKAGLSVKQIGYRFQGKRMSQADLGRVLAKMFDFGVYSPTLEKLTNPDIYWDRVTSKTTEPGGPVFDRVVPEFHNFVVNGVVVHNSGNLEQDADRVQFLHAPEKNPLINTLQDPFDDSLSTLYIEAIQAKGRGEGQARAPLSFHRPTTRFLSIQQ